MPACTTLVANLTIFALAVFLGFGLISRVPTLLHALMSGTNAIHGIVLVGAMLIAGSRTRGSSRRAFVAVVFATVNVVGGFLVTDRMLEMFRRKPDEADDAPARALPGRHQPDYLVAAILLIVGIEAPLASIDGALGNWIAAVGMAIALVFTLASPEIDSYWLIVAGVALRTVIGIASARLVRMTAMPQMVALFSSVEVGSGALIARLSSPARAGRRRARGEHARGRDVLGADRLGELLRERHRLRPSCRAPAGTAAPLQRTAGRRTGSSSAPRLRLPSPAAPPRSKSGWFSSSSPRSSSASCSFSRSAARTCRS